MLLLTAAWCGGAQSSTEDGGGTTTQPLISSTGTVGGDPLPNSSGFAYYVSGPPGSGIDQMLDVIFTTRPGATCGSTDAVPLANQGNLAGVSALILSVAVTASSTALEPGTYAWENYGGVATASYETAAADCSFDQAGITGGLVSIDSLGDTEVKGSCRLDITTPSTTGTCAVPFCGALPQVASVAADARPRPARSRIFGAAGAGLTGLVTRVKRRVAGYS